MTALFLSSQTVTRVHRVDGHDWRILRSGTGSRVVLLLPGGVGQAEAEYQVIHALESHVQVIAVTYPPLRTMSALVEGLLGVLDAENLETVNVWGNSFGGMVAQILVRAAPQRVRNLALGRRAVPDRVRRRRSEAQGRLLAALPAPIVRQLVRMAFARLLRELPDGERTWSAPKLLTRPLARQRRAPAPVARRRNEG